MLKLIRNRIIEKLDPEISAIGRIIRNSISRGIICHECDDVFIQRLLKYPVAYKMSFWEEHFEWKSLRDYPEINGHVLDFGCGTGHSDVFLARNGYMIHGVDLSNIAIKIALDLRKSESKEVQERLSFEVTDVTVPVLNSVKYDSVWSSHVFEHIVDPGPVLNGLRRLVNPGAHLLVSVPYGNAYDDPGHVNHFYTSGELAEFLGLHVTVKRIDVSHQFNVLRALCHFVDV